MVQRESKDHEVPPETRVLGVLDHLVIRVRRVLQVLMENPENQALRVNKVSTTLKFSVITDSQASQTHLPI